MPIVPIGSGGHNLISSPLRGVPIRLFSFSFIFSWRMGYLRPSVRTRKKNGPEIGDEELLSLRMGAWGFPCPLSSAHPNLVLPPQPEADDEVVGGHKMSEPVIG